MDDFKPLGRICQAAVGTEKATERWFRNVCKLTLYHSPIAHVWLPPAAHGRGDCAPRRPLATSSERRPPLKVSLHQKAQPIRPDVTLPWPHGWCRCGNPPSSSSCIPPPTLLRSSPPHRQPKRCCCCQNPAALSSSGGISVSQSATRVDVRFCPRTRTHARVASSISLLAALSLVPCIPSPLFPLFPTLVVTSHTLGPLPARGAHHLASELIVSDSSA